MQILRSCGIFLSPYVILLSPTFRIASTIPCAKIIHAFYSASLRYPSNFAELLSSALLISSFPYLLFPPGRLYWIVVIPSQLHWICKCHLLRVRGLSDHSGFTLYLRP